MHVQTKRATAAARWIVVVPFKGGTAAKSRLGMASGEMAGIGAEDRRELALAFLTDTVAAAARSTGVAAVIIVSSDPDVPMVLPGHEVVADPARGLNTAVAAGIGWARRRFAGNPIAAMTGDLPCLRPRDLSMALSMAERHALGVVPDHDGNGTTLITALPGVPVAPRFGGLSCRAHRQAGHDVLRIPAESTLRRDVDTVADLRRAMNLGVGAGTTTTLERLDLWQQSTLASRGTTPASLPVAV